MAQIASVAAITGTGKAFAVNEQGVSRELKAGDVLQKGETIRTTGDVRVELLMDDGRLLAVAPNQVLRLDENVSESDQRPTAQDSAVGAPAATADTVLQALERGTDLSTELEATAAGLGGGGGADGGSSFVQLLRIVEGVDPLAYQYDYTAPDLLPDLQATPEIVPLVEELPEPVTVSQTLLVEEESVPDSGGIDEADGGNYTATGSVWSGGASGVVTTITIAGFAPVTVAAGGSTLFFDQDGNPIPSDSEAEAAAQLTVSPDGTYTFTMLGAMNHVPGAGENDLDMPLVVLSGTASDGAPTTANLSLSVQDDVPSISADVPVADTEEMALVTSDAGGEAASAQADFSGAFSFTTDEGADTATLSAISYALSVTGAADQETGLVDSGLMTSAGNAAIYLYEVQGLIVGSTATDAENVGEANTVFSLTVDEDGQVTLNQYQAIEHVVSGDPLDQGAEDFTADGDFADDAEALAAGLVGLTATQTITDADGDTQTAESEALDLGGLVSFTDVGPSISADVPVADTDTMALVTSDAGGEAASAQADFSGAFSFTTDEGADTATLSAISYALSVTGAADEVSGLVASGLMTSDGDLPIYLYEDGGTIYGSTSDVADGSGVDESNTVFSLTVDEDGQVTLNQYQAIEHVVSGDPLDQGAEDFTADGDFADDAEALAAGLVGLTATQTITDADGDTQTAESEALDLGGLVSFTDVGPDLSASANDVSQVVLTTSDAATVGANFGTANTNYASAFTFTPTQGADTATQGTISYELVLKAAANVDTNDDTVLDHVDSGLKTSVGDAAIYLYNVGGVIVGSTSLTAPTAAEITAAATDANIVFTLSNSAGTVTLNQYQAIEHVVSGDPLDQGAEDFATDGNFADDAEVLANSLVALRATQTITDADGDTKTASADLDLGGNVKFTDVGPIAVNEPTMTLTESHVADTDGLLSTKFIDKDDGFVNVTTLNGLTGGDTLKIDWTTSGSATVNWELRSGNTVVAFGTANDGATLSAALSSSLATGNYTLWVDSSKDMTVSDVHVLHTVTTTEAGNVMVGDTVGADGAAVYSITYVKADGTTETELLGSDGVAEVVTKYGTLRMEADGDYTYTVKQDAVPSTETDSQVEDNFSYTLMDGDGDTASAAMNYVINDIKSPSVLDVTMITNTNNQIQPVILTFVDQVNPEYAYARLFALGAQGQQGTFTPDTGFNINNNNNYVVGLEAASTTTKVNLTDFTIEGVPIFGQATGGGGGVTSLILDDDSSISSDQTAMVAVITPNTPPATQALTDSTDGDGTGTTMTDSSGSTVNYLYGAGGNDILNGSTGTDILNGGAGVDSLKGGGGNDMLVYDSSDINDPSLGLSGLLDGGDGDDVLRIDDGALALFNNPSLGTQAIVDLTNNMAIKNVEVLLITDDAEGAADKGTTLVLRAEDVLNFTDSDHTLTIAGNNSDALDLSADTTATWANTGTSSDGNFAIWTATLFSDATTVTLKVENEVYVNGNGNM